MFYQPIVLSEKLYSVGTRRLSDFPEHWHSDLELIYCSKGFFFVKIEDCEYRIQAGDILFVGSAVPHMYYGTSEDNLITILRVGSIFFRRRALYGYCKEAIFHPDLTGRRRLKCCF